MKTVAFFGLGNMGRPMALNLMEKGFRVVGYDVMPQALQAFVAANGLGATSPLEAIADADAIVTMLPTGQHARQLYLGEQGILAHCKKGALFIDSSTIDVETARLLGQEASSRDLDFLDAPVSGGTGGATAGTLTFMIGGASSAFERARPLFEAMGKNLIHCGDVGAGQAAKICNNAILGVTMAAVAEAFTLADKLGLDRQKLFDVASTSSGQCWALTSYCPVPGPVPSSPANRGYQPGFTAAMMVKDMRLAIGAAHQTGAACPTFSSAAELYAHMVAYGHGQRDFSGIFSFLQPSNDV